MLKVWLILSGVLGLLGSTIVFAAPSLKLAERVLQVRGVDADGRLFFGSAVVVEPGWAATNCHVVRTGGLIRLSLGHEVYAVTEERVDEYADLCLLHAPALKIPPVKRVSASQLARGVAMGYYGYPRGLGLSYAEGVLKRVVTHSQLPLIETSAFFTLGGSGGGLFDSQGRLIGLATFMTRGHAGGYFGIGSDQIGRVRKRPAQPITALHGQAFWEQTGFELGPENKRPGR